ncbi:MAG: glycosyltransferase family 4 protein [Rhodospirillales bacterium]|nr:MAG: glycosyltransferase family 4 protein [Rhodospirillales bacterium]
MAAPTASAAIYYKAEEFDPTKRMMGRQVASEAFLRAVARYDPSSELHVYAARPEETQVFARVIAAMNDSGAPAAQARQARWVRHGDIAGLAKAGCLYRPDPVLHDEAWLRRFGDPRAYSLTGVTHTISSAGAQKALAQYLTAPYEAWDAVICTSEAVRRAVAHLLAENADYLAERLGMAAPPAARLRLPVIPLGVHTDQFDTTTSAMRAARERRRHALGIAPDDVVALFVGRLAFHAKANPYPMYVALEAAAKRCGRKVHLVQAGWFGTPHIESAFKDGAAKLCPSVTCHFLDGRDASVRAEVWAMGDLFTSLVDNVQETFGLAPVEAMAAGLPVVAADWDGYRETVRDGVDGFLIATTQTPPGFGEAMAQRHLAGVDSYDMYIAGAALNAAVDIGAAADAYAALIDNADLRRRMTLAGRRRAHDTFEWRRIYAMYRELWGELAAIRAAAPSPASRAAGRSVNPLHPDPFRMFGHYPTYTYGARSRVRAADSRDAAAWAATLEHPLLRAGETVMPRQEEIAAVRAALALAADGMSVAELLERAAAPGRRDALVRGLAWFLKAGLIAIDDRIAVPDRPPPLE